MSFRICSIGCGGMSTFAHGPSLARYAALHTDTELAACCDLNQDNAEQYRDAFGFARYYTDLVRMLDAERPDAVCLVVPESMTCRLACIVLEMGYPLITEKPPGRTLEEIDGMIAAAQANGVPTQVAFNRRYMPLMAELKRLLSEQFGPSDIHHVSYDFTRVGRIDADFSLTAIHGIDAAKYIASSDYRCVRFHYRELPEAGPSCANIYMDCVFESGATGRISFCPTTGASGEKAVVHLHDNTMVLNVPLADQREPQGALLHYRKNELVLAVTGSEYSETSEEFILGGFYDENKTFFDDVRTGRIPLGALTDARQSVEIAQCIRERRAEYQPSPERSRETVAVAVTSKYEVLT